MRKLTLLILFMIVSGVPLMTLGQVKGADARAVKQLPSKEKRWALIIGVDDYKNGIQKLYGTVNDSRALKEALIKYAGFPEDQVLVLTTGKGDEQPTRTNIISRLHRLKGKVPKDGLLLFAFSGHGVERNKQVFLLPSDVWQTREIEELKETAINVELIKLYIKTAEIQQVLIFLDACRNDPEAGRGDVDNPLTEAYRNGFSFDVQNKEVGAFATFYATSIGKRAYEFTDKETGLSRGFFSWALVKGLEGGAANDKGEITLGGLVHYVAEAVPKKLKAENFDGDQHPYPEIGGYKADELVIALSHKNTLVAGTDGSSDPQVHFNRGRTFQNEGKFDLAIEEYDEAIRLNPNYAAAYFNKGNAYDSKGDDDQAIKSFDRAIALDPKYPVAYFNRGNAYSYKGILDKAIDDYDKAIKLNPRYADAFVNRGIAYVDKKNLDRAIEDYTKAIQINSKHGLAYYNRGLAYDEQDHCDKAIEDYSTAIALNSNNLDAYYRRGKVYGAKGDFDNAINDFSVFLALNPQNGEALVYRAVLYAARGKNKESIEDLNKAIELYPQFGDAYTQRGQIFSIVGNEEKALADFNKAIEYNPQDSGAYVGRGGVYRQRGRYDLAASDFKRAVSLNPEDMRPYLNLGFTYVIQGDYVRANEYFQKMKQLNQQAVANGKCKTADILKEGLTQPMGINDQDGFEFYIEAVVHLGTRDFGKAIDELSQGIKQYPQFVLLYFLRAMAYYLKGDNDGAMSDIKLLIALNPADVNAYMLRGDVQTEMGEYKQAVDSYSEVIRLEPNHLQAYRDRADAYEKIGDKSKAKTDRQKADEMEKQQNSP